MERGALGRRQRRSSRVGIDDEGVELGRGRSRTVRRWLELLRNPEHGLLLLRHHRHLHAGRRRDADGHGERVLLPASIAIGARARLLLLLPPRGVLVQAVQQQLVEAPGLQESTAQMESPTTHACFKDWIEMLLVCCDQEMRCCSLPACSLSAGCWCWAVR